MLKEFTDPKADMHPDKITNIEMGYIFEEIIRRFSEAHNEDAGQHYTPREVIELMVNILFAEDSDLLSGNAIAKTIYDIILQYLIQRKAIVKKCILQGKLALAG